MVPILVTLAVGYAMLWAALAKKRCVLICRSCGRPAERCSCQRPGPPRSRGR